MRAGRRQLAFAWRNSNALHRQIPKLPECRQPILLRQTSRIYRTVVDVFAEFSRKASMTGSVKVLAGSLLFLGLFLVILAEIEPKLRLLIRSKDVHGDNFAFFLLLEDGIHNLQQEGFEAGFSLGDIAVDLHPAVQIDFVIQNVVGSLHACSGSGNAETEIGKV